MTEYKSNSHRSKEQATVPEKKVEKIVCNGVKTKKKNKLADVFVTEDIRNVKDYIIMDVLIPAAKKALSDIVTNGIDMILYGETRSNKSKGSKVSYSKYYDDRDRDRYRGGSYERSRTNRMGYAYDEIILESRGEAEEVLNKMDELLDVYGVVSVADLYDLVGISGNYTDNKYGWTNLRAASVQRLRDGYLLKLPKALPLD